MQNSRPSPRIHCNHCLKMTGVLVSREPKQQKGEGSQSEVCQSAKPALPAEPAEPAGCAEHDTPSLPAAEEDSREPAGGPSQAPAETQGLIQQRQGGDLRGDDTTGASEAPAAASLAPPMQLPGPEMEVRT